MKASCLINNFNYGKYLQEAIDSALNQTEPFLEVIIVDDGSTDESREVMLRYQNHPQVKLFFEEHAGQLAACCKGLEQATGDLICFLDSDDCYKPHYLKTMLDFYNENPSCDFVFCAREIFGEELPSKVLRSFKGNRNFGSLRILNLVRKFGWVGGASSTLTGKASLLKKLLPISNLQDWMTRADDCFIYGVDVLGGHKFYLDEPLVRYRIHGGNDSLKIQKRWKTKEYQELHCKQLFSFLQEQVEKNFDVKELKQAIQLQIRDLYLKNLTFNETLLKLKYTRKLLNLGMQEAQAQPFYKKYFRFLVIFINYCFGVKFSSKIFL